MRGRRGRDRMIMDFTTTCAVSDYHHKGCKFESPHDKCDKCFSELRQVGGFLRALRFPSPIKLIATIYLKYHRHWR